MNYKRKETNSPSVSAESKDRIALSTIQVQSLLTPDENKETPLGKLGKPSCESDLHQGTEGQGGSTSQKHLKVLDVILWLTLALGLLPWGKDGQKWTCRRAVKACLSSLVTLTMCLAFIGIHEVMITLDHLAKFSSTYWICEKFFAFALTIPGIFNIVVFWRRSGEFALLLDGFRGIAVHRDFTMKTAVSELLLFVCLGGVQLYSNSVWYVSYTSQIPSLLRVLFFLSFIWLISSLILPPLCYAALGSVLANAFRHTNELLAQALRNKGDEELSIRAINQQLSSLRELQGRLVTMLSLPLFGFCIFMFYMFANYFFYSVVSGLVQDVTVIIPGILVAAFLGFILVTVVGYTADNIQAEASAPIRILLQEELRTSPEDAPHTWNEDPLKMSIYQMCEEPLLFNACGFLNITRSSLLVMINAATSYLMIFLQFHLLEKPVE